MAQVPAGNMVHGTLEVESNAKSRQASKGKLSPNPETRNAGNRVGTDFPRIGAIPG
jgi:hypothetical protein